MQNVTGGEAAPPGRWKFPVEASVKEVADPGYDWFYN